MVIAILSSLPTVSFGHVMNYISEREYIVSPAVISYRNEGCLLFCSPQQKGRFYAWTSNEDSPRNISHVITASLAFARCLERGSYNAMSNLDDPGKQSEVDCGVRPMSRDDFRLPGLEKVIGASYDVLDHFALHHTDHIELRLERCCRRRLHCGKRRPRCF